MSHDHHDILPLTVRNMSRKRYDGGCNGPGKPYRLFPNGEMMGMMLSEPNAQEVLRNCRGPMHGDSASLGSTALSPEQRKEGFSNVSAFLNVKTLGLST